METAVEAPILSFPSRDPEIDSPTRPIGAQEALEDHEIQALQ